MDIDFYTLFGLNRNFNENELKSFVNIVDRILKDTQNDQQRYFSRLVPIARAYIILSNPIRKQVYDQYGMKGIDPETKQQLNDLPAVPLRDLDPILQSLSSIYQEKLFGKKKAFSRLSCSLNELYCGCRKKLSLSGTSLGGNHHLIEPRSFEVCIKPGMKDGDTIYLDQEVYLVIEEKPHILYKRSNHDLIYNYSLTLQDALLGVSFCLKTLDNRCISIEHRDVVKPDTVIEIANEGMPKPDSPNNERGKLKIYFNIKFPTKIDDENRMILDKLTF